MKSRLDPFKISPTPYNAMLALETFLGKSSKLESSVIELVKLRATQINGCAFCLDMNSKVARIEGESEQRLYTLSVWREVSFFTDRERAALAWTEAVTKIREGHVPDDAYTAAKERFSDEELVNLAWAVIAINGWNRLAIAFRLIAGEYDPAPQKIGAK